MTGPTAGPTARARRGRRPGAPDTRAAILGAARELFASSGYAGTSIRAVAAAAGVDAALVHHYFGTKDDPIAMAERLGPRLRHIHLTDGTGSAKDEHLVPGRGVMRAGEFLQHVADAGFGGDIVLEINTRRSVTEAEREKDLRESLEFAREHFFAATP